MELSVLVVVCNASIEDVGNATYTVNNNGYLGEIIYRCDEGYKWRANNLETLKITCQANATWEETPPDCLSKLICVFDSHCDDYHYHSGWWKSQISHLKTSCPQNLKNIKNIYICMYS